MKASGLKDVLNLTFQYCKRFWIQRKRAVCIQTSYNCIKGLFRSYLLKFLYLRSICNAVRCTCHNSVAAVSFLAYVAAYKYVKACDSAYRAFFFSLVGLI